MLLSTSRDLLDRRWSDDGGHPRSLRRRRISSGIDRDYARISELVTASGATVLFVRGPLDDPFWLGRETMFELPRTSRHRRRRDASAGAAGDGVSGPRPAGMGRGQRHRREPRGASRRHPLDTRGRVRPDGALARPDVAVDRTAVTSDHDRAPVDGADDETAEFHALVGEIRDAGVRRVHVLAWRDLDDPDAGGSEVHADHFMRRWADAGLDVLHRTSAGLGIPATARRNGYDVVRRGTRYTVFPRTVVAELTRRMGRFDGLVEIWNGVPWFSPVWCHRPRITIVHHVHGPMWDQILPRTARRARPGARDPGGTAVLPPDRRSSRPAIRRATSCWRSGSEPERVTAVDNGVEPFFTPGERRYDHPTIVATARLAPVKRFGMLIEAAAAARATDPRPPGADHRRGARTRRPRGLDPTPRRGIVGHARRLRAARPTGGRVPAGVDRRQRLDRRGLGARAHRGGGVRHAGGRDRHLRAIVRRSSTA